MELSARHIKDKKKIGTWNGISVMNLLTKGGLNIIASAKNGLVKILGLGPMMSVAKHVATESFPDIVWDESALSKSESQPLDPKIVQKYTDLTNRARALENE